jgi:hypothetical protein
VLPWTSTVAFPPVRVHLPCSATVLSSEARVLVVVSGSYRHATIMNPHLHGSIGQTDKTHLNLKNDVWSRLVTSLCISTKFSISVVLTKGVWYENVPRSYSGGTCTGRSSPRAGHVTPCSSPRCLPKEQTFRGSVMKISSCPVASLCNSEFRPRLDSLSSAVDDYAADVSGPSGMGQLEKKTAGAIRKSSSKSPAIRTRAPSTNN